MRVLLRTLAKWSGCACLLGIPQGLQQEPRGTEWPFTALGRSSPSAIQPRQLPWTSGWKPRGAALCMVLHHATVKWGEGRLLLLLLGGAEEGEGHGGCEAVVLAIAG